MQCVVMQNRAGAGSMGPCGPKGHPEGLAMTPLTCTLPLIMPFQAKNKFRLVLL